MNRFLFALSDFLSRPPGFYVMMAAMAAGTVVAWYGEVNVVTYALSVLAIVITGVVLIQNYRDTAAIQVKLDAIIEALDKAPNRIVGLEHAEPDEIEEERDRVERQAAG